jgi:hypothetical protein
MIAAAVMSRARRSGSECGRRTGEHVQPILEVFAEGERAWIASLDRILMKGRTEA